MVRSALLLGFLTFPGIVVAQQASGLAEVALGPAWRGGLAGVRVTGHRYLSAVDRPFALRLEAGARWTPSQTVAYPSILAGPGGRYVGEAQEADLALGTSGVLRPWPLARHAPYLVMGVSAVQWWNRGQGAFQGPSGFTVPEHRESRGALGVTVGAGFRTTVAGRRLALEARSYHRTFGLSVGTDLH